MGGWLPVTIWKIQSMLIRIIPNPISQFHYYIPPLSCAYSTNPPLLTVRRCPHCNWLIRGYLRLTEWMTPSKASSHISFEQKETLWDYADMINFRQDSHQTGTPSSFSPSSSAGATLIANVRWEWVAIIGMSGRRVTSTQLSLWDSQEVKRMFFKCCNKKLNNKNRQLWISYTCVCPWSAECVCPLMRSRTTAELSSSSILLTLPYLFLCWVGRETFCAERVGVWVSL